MMEAIASVPKTALDVFRMLPEGTLCEVINNTLYMSPAPRVPHQDLVSFFLLRIGSWVEKNNMGKTLVSPVDVYLEKFSSAVQPDLLFISNNNMSIIKEDGYIYGAPDLIVEVLSEDKKRETVLKKELYERAGVKEYFVVDPISKSLQRFDFFQGNFHLSFESQGKFISVILGYEFSF